MFHFIKNNKSVLTYDDANGEFRWVRAYRKPTLTGQLAGRLGNSGYLLIKIDGLIISASRLAWETVFGEIPEGKEIDHINRNKQDNSICNLRLSTRYENLMNTRYRETTNASFHKPSGLWRARHSGKVKYFTTQQEAIAGRMKMIEERL